MVDLDELDEIALEELAQPLERSASGVEHEDIQAPVLSADLLEHRRDFVPMADIGPDGHRPGPTLHELLGERRGLGLRASSRLAIVEDQVGTRLTELAGDDPPQPPRTASDQGHATVTGSHLVSSCSMAVGQRAMRLDQPK